MNNQEIFMKGYFEKWIKITFLDGAIIIGLYVNYYYFNNVIVIMPYKSGDDTRALIPLSAIKMIEPWYIEERDILEGVGRVISTEEE
ncbi:hypothetical protein [Paenibacillus wenxiniae]|uniref:PRC-barrel domain-containing protein n=1 Tax=Paenibacillus wenxiniae TaxID=1636843 RepID=A0ABW4RLV1_9BACL